MAVNSLFAYMEGVYAPVDKEHTDFDLKTIGNIPADMHGAYVQNNPNPRFAPKGLYHGLTLGGEAPPYNDALNSKIHSTACGKRAHENTIPKQNQDKYHTKNGPRCYYCFLSTQ